MQSEQFFKQLKRPLVFFDLETTGTNVLADRIVQIAAKKIHQSGEIESYQSLINPGMKIPPSTTEVHGITNEMVKDAPCFKDQADLISVIFQGCDLAGYNIMQFDVPLLSEEFSRCKIDFPQPGTNYIDVLKLFKVQEKRDLAGALRFYTGEEIRAAHDAMGDVNTTMDVFMAQLNKYMWAEQTVNSLQLVSQDGKPMVDIAGKLALNQDGEIVFAFGKSTGVPVKKDRGFAEWMLGTNTFAPETKRKLREALK